MPQKTLRQRKHMYDDCADKNDPGLERCIDESVMKEIAADFRTLPTFEKSLYEKGRMKHFSMQKNEKLLCCWQKYIENIEKKRSEPFHFPKITDLHYYRYAVEFIPSENKWQFDTRLKLSAGPGVDEFGQKPIPNELLMKRSGNGKDIARIRKKSVQTQTE
uniref:Uncharacterized protein n=1 Tax=Heliothis virescens TaxID=7102 RepID=A0A2A4JJ22_HELVI